MSDEQQQETKEERKARLRAEFDAIPEERTFATIKLYLNSEDQAQGTLAYRGDRLRVLGVGDEVAADCRKIAQLAHQSIQEVVYLVGMQRAGQEVLVGILSEMFGGDNDSKGEGSGEGSEQRGSSDGEQQQQPASSVSGNS